MTGPGPTPGHGDLGPELRRLAQAVLDRLDPAVRAAALAAVRSGGGPGKCQQVWCPVCALAALVTGEQHPLLTLIAEHSVGLLTVVRMMVDGSAQPPDPDGPEPAAGPGAPQEHIGAPRSNGRYQPIRVSMEE
jgi:hypothetical protein